MRFFTPSGVMSYPDTETELRAQILAHSTIGPQRIPCAFFDTYFTQGGDKMHPILGNLELLVSQILSRWNSDTHGQNLVVSLLNFRLTALEDAVAASEPAPSPTR